MNNVILSEYQLMSLLCRAVFVTNFKELNVEAYIFKITEKMK